MSSLVYIVSLGHQSYVVRYNKAEMDVYLDEIMIGGRDREWSDASQVQGCQGSCWELAETRGGLPSSASAENRALTHLPHLIYTHLLMGLRKLLQQPSSSHCSVNIRASGNVFQLISLLVT